MKFISHSVTKQGDYILRFQHYPLWRKLLLLKPVEVAFIGSGSVWRHYPEFSRCGTMMECHLCDVWCWVKYMEREA